MLTLRNLSRHYRHGEQTVPAVDDVSLSLVPGEVLALLGPSGCGKSTLLRLIAGLESPTGGEILWGDERWHTLPPEKRQVGMVFQDYALFPHLTVLDNVRFGLVERRVPKEEALRRATDWMSRLHIEHLADRLPSALSGGQQQRVALARALAIEPRILLLDEPLSNLDEALRAVLLDELQAVLGQTHVTTLLVTHDQREAFSLGQRVALMRDGSILQLDTPAGLYGHPCNAWAARFLGHANVQEGCWWPETAFRFDGPGRATVLAASLRGSVWRLDLRDEQGAVWTLTLSQREWAALDAGAAPVAGQTLPFRVAPQAAVSFAT